VTSCIAPVSCTEATNPPGGSMTGPPSLSEMKSTLME